jgi:lysophospholipase L1-like esterase
MNPMSTRIPRLMIIAGEIQLKKVAFGFVLLILCQLPGSEVVANQLTILAFGDSITQGFKRNSSGARWGIQYVPHGARVGGYEPYLERQFSSNGLVAYVYNWGYAGERTTGGLRRLKNIVNSHAGIYDYCLIMEGANDLYAGINANTTAFNLGVMADTCRNSGMTPILATITPNTYLSSGRKIPLLYNPAIAAVALRKGVVLADQYATVNPKWQAFNSGDGLHLNRSGDKAIAIAWFSALGTRASVLDLSGVYNMLLFED